MTNDAPGADAPVLNTNTPDAGGPILGSTDIGGGDAPTAPDNADAQTPAATPAALPVQGADGLAPLPDNATDEQRAQFEQKLRALAGVPNSPDEYGDFDLGDKINKSSPDYALATKKFHEFGLSKKQAKGVVEEVNKWLTDKMQAAQRNEADAIKEYRAAVKRDFVKSLGGDAQFTEFSEQARRGFMASAKGAGLSEKEMSGIINIMGDDPRFVKIFNSIGKHFREDVLVTGSAPSAMGSGSSDEIFEEKFKSMFGGK
jgi:hypothetical protein